MKNSENNKISSKPAPNFSGTIRPNGRIWIFAEQFCKAADLIWKNDDIDLNEFIFPMIVNYALCAELSLKATEGGPVGGGLCPDGLIKASKIMSTAHGHNLYKVFSLLQPLTQTEISIEFFSITGEKLEPLLARCSDYFISARYDYERIGGSYDLTGIRTLAKGLLNATKAFGSKHP